MATETQLIIDDTDPRIQYSLGWSNAGSSNEFKSTVHKTTTTGASFTFAFNGTGIAVLGTIDGPQGRNGPPNSSYSLDNATPVSFNGPIIPGVTYQQLFYQSPAVPNTEHTLIGNCTDQGSAIFVDYLVVTSPLPAPSSAQTAVTVTRTAGVQASGAETSLRVDTGVIVGATIGSAALILIFVGSLLLYRHKETHKAAGLEEQESVITTAVTPLPPSEPFTSNYEGITESWQASRTPNPSQSPPAYMAEYAIGPPVTQVTQFVPAYRKRGGRLAWEPPNAR